MFYESKSCLVCRMRRVVTIYPCKHNIKPVLANIPKQLIQKCSSLVN